MAARNRKPAEANDGSYAGEVLAAFDRLAAEGVCVICGCDDLHACPGGCHWVQPDLCSACVENTP